MIDKMISIANELGFSVAFNDNLPIEEGLHFIIGTRDKVEKVVLQLDNKEEYEFADSEFSGGEYIQ
jgi:hypothetical protein